MGARVHTGLAGRGADPDSPTARGASWALKRRRRRARRRRWLLFAAAAFIAACGSGGRGGGGDGAAADHDARVTLPARDGPDGGARNGDGGGGVPAITPVTLQGKLALPAGFPLAMDRLRITAAGGSAVPDAEGRFSVASAGRGRQGLLLTDEAGRVVLFGWARPGDGNNALTTLHTAAALLFLGSGAAYLPVAGWDRAVDLLQADPHTAALARFLDGKLAGNPAFLALATGADVTALGAALGEALAGMAPTLSRVQQGLVLVNPGLAKSGITVLVGDKDGTAGADVNQITFMNEYRRRAFVFIERQAYQSSSYIQEAAFELPPTNGLNGAIGSVTDVINGNGAWTPVYYGPVGLGTVTSEDEVITYRVRVVGPGTPGDAELTPAQQRQQAQTAMKGFLIDYYLPAFFSLLDFDWLGGFLQSPFMGELATTMASMAYSGGLLTIGNYVDKGDLFGAATEMGNALTGNAAFRDWMLEELRIGIIDAYGPGEAFKFAQAASGAILGALQAIDKISGVVNLVNVATDAAKSKQADEWQVKVRAPKVLLTPAKAKLACGEKTAFDVVVKNGGQRLTGDLVYAFENTAQFGHLTTDANAGYEDTFEATRPRVYYTVNTDGSRQGTDKITVKVHLVVAQDKGKEQRQLLGEAQAEVTVQDQCLSSDGYVGGDGYTSGCTRTLTVPAVVHPGEQVKVSVAAARGGVCGSSWVWMSFAAAASLDGGPPVGARMGGGGGIYDFCYGGGPQPFVPGGAGVDLPDDQAHTITFTIDPKLKCPVCVKEVLDGTPCSSNAGNRQNINGPAVVNGGSGGTHGWSTVRFFQVKVP
jgi:hypothetical protein